MLLLVLITILGKSKVFQTYFHKNIVTLLCDFVFTRANYSIISGPHAAEGLSCYHCGSIRHILKIGELEYGNILPCSNKNKGIEVECSNVKMNDSQAVHVGCIKGDTG